MEYIDFEFLNAEQKQAVISTHGMRLLGEFWPERRNCPSRFIEMEDFSFPIRKDGILAKMPERISHRRAKELQGNIFDPVHESPEKGGYMHLKTCQFGLNKEPYS